MSRYEHRFDIQHHRAMQNLLRLQDKARRPPVSVARADQENAETLTAPNQAMLPIENPKSRTMKHKPTKGH